MLIQFIVENFYSFREETVFNLIAGDEPRHEDHIQRITQPSVDLLKVSAIYGANASGKSNLINSIEFARDLILYGTRGDETISTHPFRLDADAADRPSRFQFLIYHDGRIFDYGFALDSSGIHEEWLFVKSNRNFKKMFERITTKNGKNRYSFGPSLVRRSSKKKFDRYNFEMEGTRANQLFLTEAFNRNIPEIVPVMQWFKYSLVILSPNSRYSALELRAEQDKKFNGYICELLKLADTGIETISTTVEALDMDRQFPDIPANKKQQIIDKLNQLDKLDKKGILIFDGRNQYTISRKEDGQSVLVKLKMCHRGAEDQLIDFQIEEESEGTQRLIHLAPAFADLWENEKVYLIDELDRRLHPNLTISLIELYLQGHIKKENRQLILITHEANLLDLRLFRKDEIWFVEKDRDGASHLFSLAEFKVRPDLDIQNGYLKGRFGAIPFLGNMERLGWIDEKENQGIC